MNEPHSGDLAERRRVWRVAALFVALTAVLTYPLSLHPATHILGGGADPYLCVWLLSWDVHAFTHQPLAIFDANIFAPLPNTLAYAENLIGSALVAAPIIWMTQNALLAMNVIALLSVPVSGLGAYLLGRRVGLSPRGAVLAGLIYAFAPPRFLRLEQFQLTTIQWIPFCLAYLHGYLDTGRRRDLRLALAFFSLQALTAGHGAVLLTVGVVLLLLYRLALGEPVALLKRLGDVGVIGGLALLPAALIFVPYHRAQVQVGLVRTLKGWNTAASSFLASPTYVDVYLSRFWPAWLRENPTAYLFPGYVTLLLVAMAWFAPRPRREPRPATSGPVWHRAVAAAQAWRQTNRRNARMFYALLTLVCLWFLLGPPFGAWQLVYRWPVFSLVRVPTRFILLGMLSLAVLAGMGVDRLSARLPPRRATWLLLLLGAAAVAEFAIVPPGIRPYGAEIPAVDRWLASRPKPFTVAEVPLHDPDNLTIRERQNVYYMLYSTAHWQKTVHGYSGWLPPEHEKLYEAMSRFPDEESLRRLAGMHVTYVVVHLYDYDPARLPDLEAALARYRTWLTLEHADGLGRVYSLHEPH